MSSTNKTTHYELSQFIGTDKPAWLTDYNGDMLKIDTGLAAAAAEASGAQGTATSAASAAQAAQNTANQAVTSAQANAEDLTELKAALTNTMDNMTLLGNANVGSAVASYSDYIQTFKVYLGWETVPNNTSIRANRTLIPLASMPGNIFKIASSTLTDNTAKVYCGMGILIYNTSTQNYMPYVAQVEAYYDGTNTILYWSSSTSLYTTITKINTLSGNFTVLFSGNFVNIQND